MSIFREKLQLPKTYRPAAFLRVSFLIAGLAIMSIFGPLVVLVFVYPLTNQMPFSILAAFIFLEIALILILMIGGLYFVNIFVMRLSLTEKGILFVALGQRFFTPWSNVKAFRDWRNVQAIELEQATELFTVKKGLQRNIAVLEVAWWYAWWRGRNLSNFLPLPQIFDMPALDTKDLALYIAKYTSLT